MLQLRGKKFDVEQENVLEAFPKQSLSEAVTISDWLNEKWRDNRSLGSDITASKKLPPLLRSERHSTRLSNP
jgi:hypothetical protein